MKKLSLYYRKLTGWYNPESVFVQIFGGKDTVFWLDSSRVEEGLSRFSYMGEAAETISYSINKKKDIFSILSERLEEMGSQKSALPFDFVGGFVGYFGYELKAFCGAQNSFSSDYPDSLWFFVDRFLAFDHEEKEVYAVSLAENKKEADDWFEKIQVVVCHNETSSGPQDIDTSEKMPNSFRHGNIIFALQRNHNQYLKDIARCKEYLRDGESYQICLTNTLTTHVNVESLALYSALRRINPAPYSAYFKYKDFAVLCSSPERFLKVDTEGWIESKPIKGTRNRSQDVKEDNRLAAELLASEKDRAENLMITDLLRNDLGKVCEIGSVSVPKLMAIESYATVHQLVSTVRGRLRKEVSVLEAIKACFPGGSMTGAPKLRTLEILETLEKQARGVYSGALGFLSVNGTVDLNIVIRTIVQNGNTLSIGAGGAILMQSEAEKEYEEMMLKTCALLQAVKEAAGATFVSVKE